MRMVWDEKEQRYIEQALPPEEERCTYTVPCLVSGRAEDGFRCENRRAEGSDLCQEHLAGGK